MNRVIYVLSGPSHAPNLVASIYSLRQHYHGPIDVFVWPESASYVHRMAEDEQLDIHPIPHDPAYRAHSATYVDKTTLIQHFPAEDAVLFIDADTTIHAPVDYLFKMADQYGFVVAQFNDWVSTGGIISGRLKTLREFPEIDRELINATLATRWPSANTGIFCGHSDSPILPIWKEWTYAARSSYIPDEKVMHILQPKFVPTNQLLVVDGRWNCSPMYQPTWLADKDVCIRHFHGDSNLRPKKSQRGWDLWRPWLEKCLALNIGGIADWLPDVPNKYLKVLLGELAQC